MTSTPPDIPDDAEFYGEGYDRAMDRSRLTRHCAQVLAVLRASRGVWWTYAELAGASGVPVGSCRTRISNLKAWGHKVEFRTRADRFREVRLA